MSYLYFPDTDIRGANQIKHLSLVDVIYFIDKMESCAPSLRSLNFLFSHYRNTAAVSPKMYVPVMKERLVLFLSDVKSVHLCAAVPIFKYHKQV